jgi:hypothetical protein
MSDMKKIKSKLVTIVTDNVLVVSIVGKQKSSCAHVARQGAERPHREETKKVAMRQQ